VYQNTPSTNIFSIKTAEAEFFKPPTEGKYKIIGERLPMGTRSN
jgi:hypothetical protein